MNSDNNDIIVTWWIDLIGSDQSMILYNYNYNGDRGREREREREREESTLMIV